MSIRFDAGPDSGSLFKFVPRHRMAYFCATDESYFCLRLCTGICGDKNGCRREAGELYRRAGSHAGQLDMRSLISAKRVLAVHNTLTSKAPDVRSSWYHQVYTRCLSVIARLSSEHPYNVGTPISSKSMTSASPCDG